MLDIVHANPQVFGSRDAFHVPAIERTPVLYAVGLTDMTGATVEQRPLAAAKESKNITHTPHNWVRSNCLVPRIVVALNSCLDIALDAVAIDCVTHQSGSFHFRTLPVLAIRLTQHIVRKQSAPKSLHTLAYTSPLRSPPTSPSSARCPVLIAMPFRPQHSLVMIDVDKMHTIDTRSVEDLFGMWSVFNKISDAMEDGKRLENLSWRLWNRETFVCSRMPRARKNIPLPALSSSVSSSDESDEEDVSSLLPSPVVRPELRRSESSEHRSRGRQQNHITPIDLEKMVISIKEKKSLEPLSALSMPSPAMPSPT
ncbi:hypothetical protein KCU78_g15598, partial [Aureobasidium melanogenum]